MENISVLIPQNVENMQLPNPELVNYYIDLENRVFWLDDQINEYSMELARYILQWNRADRNVSVEERKPIKIMFFSPGGELDVYRALADIIQLSKTPVWGIVVGTAYSAAGMIYLSCHVKMMLKSSSILFHKGSCAVQGSANEVYAAMMEYQQQVKELSQVILSSSTYTVEEVEERMASDWYIRPAEAVEHNICDKIVDNIEELL